MEIFGLIGVNVCYLKMISGNIGLFQILDFQKLGLNFNFVLNTLPNDSFLFNIFSYSYIWLKLLRLEIYENLRLKKIGSGKHWAILLLLCHIICRTDWCHSLLRRIIKIRRHSEKQKKKHYLLCMCELIIFSIFSHPWWWLQDITGTLVKFLKIYRWGYF